MPLSQLDTRNNPVFLARFAPFASVTTLATMVDFTDVGEIGVFVDRERLAALREHMKNTGYLENHHL